MLEPLRTESDVAALVGDDDLWDALVRRPLSEVLEDEFGDDTVRGIVATDALIGTFARMGGADLRQNVCFLYHLIGGGTGDWDVPVGGMGSVTDGLARAASGRAPRSAPPPGARGRPRTARSLGRAARLARPPSTRRARPRC